MKKVLITGANSYVGTNVEKWLMKEPDKYYVETLDMKNPNWNEFDFSKFDVVFHVAGIAHVSPKKNMKDLYFKINRDLAIETAEKAKKSGIKMFIFMSSIIVYGKVKKIGKSTTPEPVNFYGFSKLQAEENIIKLKSDEFDILIVRPPMIYGKKSKGNYNKLAKLAKLVPIFPNIKNKRSMIHIFNFCEFIKLSIDNNISGIYHPQNKELTSTSTLVELISRTNNKKILLTKLFNPIFNLFSKSNFINKIFGDLFYESSLSVYDKLNYQIIELSESISITEL